jgi:hypothetical protein
LLLAAERIETLAAAHDVRSQPGVISELARQIEAFRPKVGTPSGFNPWSAEGVAMTAARAHHQPPDGTGICFLAIRASSAGAKR